MKKLLVILSILMCTSANSAAPLKVNYKKIFGEREGCFIISDLTTGKILDEYNPARCKKRFSPYSTFKLAAVLMAFENNILKDENQIIKWDGVKRRRAELNQNLTPFTFMTFSAKWVTEWIMPQVGIKPIKKYLHTFQYGNEDFSGGLKNAWVSSSLKISAREELNFVSNFWNEKLGLTKRTTELTKKIIFIKNLSKNTELYGKTGTGCTVGHDCMNRPDKMFGWFVGIIKTPSKVYAVAGNASDLTDEKAPGGVRMRRATIDIVTQMGLVTE
ncbi:hypothetical protein C0V70_18445 [Bacteriovorax stolpii]|uniref:Penicillin-binding protein transpeptidase domain-containing protein n=1 Tax=Bacteriovorax stolpii TaxID=960 RepID=A0A2K9NX04_BACTC|nr:penicillin-binding transpeptidase domain-containing protein [Bacteriovorax stolpii]AUO00048.1 hypothetical protein C0V70_18445 [Bacteriovorax stolpii]